MPINAIDQTELPTGRSRESRSSVERSFGANAVPASMGRKRTNAWRGSAGGHIVERFEDVMRHPRYSKIIVDHKRNGSWRFGMCRTIIRPQSIDNLCVGYSELAFCKSQTRIELEVMCEQRPARDFMPGEVVLRPKGLNWASRYIGKAEMSVLALPTNTAHDVLEDTKIDFEDAVASFNVKPFWSPLLSGLVRKLDHEVFEQSNPSPLLLDGLYHAICQEVWRLSPKRGYTTGVPKGATLSDRDLHAIEQYVDESCAQQVDFAALARLTDIPRSQIAGAFKRSVGQTPYQYILARRIRRARFLIETTEMPFSEIAFRCGFSSQAHLTGTLRKKRLERRRALCAVHRGARCRAPSACLCDRDKPQKLGSKMTVLASNRCQPYLRDAFRSVTQPQTPASSAEYQSETTAAKGCCS